MEFETNVDFLGETRPCLISFAGEAGFPLIQKVEIALVVYHDYRPDGRFAPWVEQEWLDIQPILSQDQIWEFFIEIRESAKKARAEDVTESQLLQSAA